MSQILEFPSFHMEIIHTNNRDTLFQSKKEAPVTYFVMVGRLITVDAR